MNPTPAERYLVLGLQIGRHVDGVVDAYFGPPELAAEVAESAIVEPRTLVREAESLLAELSDGWLRDQVAGLRTFAGVLAGETVPYADEVEGCYGVRPVRTDETVFAEAHEQLEALLPGDGPLAERHESWRHSTRVPEDRLERAVSAVVEEARTQTRALVDLPEGEGVDLEVVRDEPWMAFNFYLGNLRSRFAVNADLPMSVIDLLHLPVHETYPGHHVERALKDHLLVQCRGLIEETVVLVPTPQSLIAEGIAELATEILVDAGGGPALAAAARGAGIEFDLTHALAVERALQPCRWAEVNAALMLYEDGSDEAEVIEYLERWGLMDQKLAAHLIRFMRDPTSRTYLITYPAGRELCRAYVGGDPRRFCTLLTEQVRVGELVDARRSGATTE